MLADLAALTDMVRQSAGARLDLCAKAPAPARTGQLITDAEQIGGLSTMAGIVSIAETATPAGPQPVTWCPERPVQAGQAAFLLWRGVRADGADADTDQLTATTAGPPPTISANNAPTVNLVEGELGHAPKWVAQMAQGDEVRIYGFFNARPTPEALATLFAAVLASKAHPLVSYNPATKQINISPPPK